MCFNLMALNSLVKKFFGVPTFTFTISFPARKQSFGPETRAFCGKSIGGKRISPGDPAVLPQVERYTREVKIGQIAEGTNQIQRIIIGRELLK